jgi:hypothetical protein
MTTRRGLRTTLLLILLSLAIPLTGCALGPVSWRSELPARIAEFEAKGEGPIKVGVKVTLIPRLNGKPIAKSASGGFEKEFASTTEEIFSDTKTFFVEWSKLHRLPNRRLHTLDIIFHSNLHRSPVVHFFSSATFGILPGWAKLETRVIMRLKAPNGDIIATHETRTAVSQFNQILMLPVTFFNAPTVAGRYKNDILKSLAVQMSTDPKVQALIPKRAPRKPVEPSPEKTEATPK